MVSLELSIFGFKPECQGLKNTFCYADKVSQEKRLKDEITQMRELATIVSEDKGTLVCEGAFGRCVANQKEVTHYDLLTGEILRNEPFKSHLYAVHRALCWSVMGMVENRFGEMM